MRKIFYLVAVITAVIFILSTINLVYHYNKEMSNRSHFVIGDPVGFDDKKNDDAYDQLLKKFSQQISVHSTKAEGDQTTYFWLSLIVTVFTAGATLVSSIQAAKKDPANTTKFAILLAILTFLTSTVNFMGNHYNELKTDEVKKVSDLKGLKSNFLLAYEKASTPDQKNEETKKYNALLDNL